MNPKKQNQARRPRPKVHPSVNLPPGPNHAHRRMLKAREHTVEAFSKATKARYIKDIQEREHRDAIKRKLIKGPKKPKTPFVSKRSQRVWNPGKKK